MSGTSVLLASAGVAAGGAILAEVWWRRRGHGRLRPLALGLVSYGLLASIGVYLTLTVFHIHRGLALHVHPLEALWPISLSDCGLRLSCPLTVVPALTFGILALTFLLNQLAVRMMHRELVGTVDPQATQLLRTQVGLGRSPSLFVLRDEQPDAYSYALLRVGSRGVRAEDIVIITRGLFDRLTPEERGAVISHELAHLQSRDDRYLPYLRSLVTLLFFDPLLHLATRRIHRRQELAADAGAARRTRNPLGLARVLVKLARAEQVSAPSQRPRVAYRAGSSLLRERIDRLAELNTLWSVGRLER